MPAAKEEPHDWWNSIPDGARWLIIAAMFTGAGSGVVGITSDTADRYHASTAQRDFAVRDVRIEYAIEEIKDIKRTVQRMDDTHPPEELIKRIDILEAQLHSVELIMVQSLNDRLD